MRTKSIHSLAAAIIVFSAALPMVSGSPDPFQLPLLQVGGGTGGHVWVQIEFMTFGQAAAFSLHLAGIESYPIALGVFLLRDTGTAIHSFAGWADSTSGGTYVGGKTPANEVQFGMPEENSAPESPVARVGAPFNCGDCFFQGLTGEFTMVLWAAADAAEWSYAVRGEPGVVVTNVASGTDVVFDKASEFPRPASVEAGLNGFGTAAAAVDASRTVEIAAGFMGRFFRVGPASASVATVTGPDGTFECTTGCSFPDPNGGPQGIRPPGSYTFSSSGVTAANSNTFMVAIDLPRLS